MINRSLANFVCMKIHLICVGKTDEKYLQEGIDKFTGRLKHYIQFRLSIVPDIKQAKGLSVADQKLKEAKSIQKLLLPGDRVILLDERGVAWTSVEFSTFLEKQAVSSVQQLVFIIGGPYGFDQTLYARADKMMALSSMTFSHQMVRLFFVEQLYRAFTIQRGEPYHHA